MRGKTDRYNGPFVKSRPHLPTILLWRRTESVDASVICLGYECVKESLEL